jgi:hypothetical protein
MLTVTPFLIVDVHDKWNFPGFKAIHVPATGNCMFESIVNSFLTNIKLRRHYQL